MEDANAAFVGKQILGERHRAHNAGKMRNEAQITNRAFLAELCIMTNITLRIDRIVEEIELPGRYVIFYIVKDSTLYLAFTFRDVGDAGDRIFKLSGHFGA